jgi:predicted  nucleic acid-binding Zn-ribbon protein
MSETQAYEEMHKRMERFEDRLENMSQQIAQVDKSQATLASEFRSLSDSILRNWTELSKKLQGYNETLYGNGKPGVKQQMNEIHRVMALITAVIVAVSCKVGYDFYRGFSMIVKHGESIHE